jgi:hypothetical protein
VRPSAGLPVIQAAVFLFARSWTVNLVVDVCRAARSAPACRGPGVKRMSRDGVVLVRLAVIRLSAVLAALAPLSPTSRRATTCSRAWLRRRGSTAEAGASAETDRWGAT